MIGFVYISIVLPLLYHFGTTPVRLWVFIALRVVGCICSMDRLIPRQDYFGGSGR